MFNYFLYKLIRKDTIGFFSSNMLRLFHGLRAKWERYVSILKAPLWEDFLIWIIYVKKVAHFTILNFLKIKVQFINIKVLSFAQNPFSFLIYMHFKIWMRKLVNVLTYPSVSLKIVGLSAADETVVHHVFVYLPLQKDHKTLMSRAFRVKISTYY